MWKLAIFVKKNIRSIYLNFPTLLNLILYFCSYLISMVWEKSYKHSFIQLNKKELIWHKELFQIKFDYVIPLIVYMIRDYAWMYMQYLYKYIIYLYIVYRSLMRCNISGLIILPGWKIKWNKFKPQHKFKLLFNM